jgi:hypothetical protein
MLIAGIQTRGASDRDEWITSYTIAYRLQYATFYEPLLNSTKQVKVSCCNAFKKKLRKIFNVSIF